MEKNKYKVAVSLCNQSESIGVTVNGNYIDVLGISSANFDHVFSPGSTDEIFEICKKLVLEGFKGVNVNILNSGSGVTLVRSDGVLKNTLALLFDSEFQSKFTFSCSMMGVTDESIEDLLQQTGRTQKLVVKKDLNKLIFVENLAEFVVDRPEDCEFLMVQAQTHEKLMQNDNTNIVFQLTIESRKADLKGLFMKSKVNFIDLAQSQKGLSALKTCIAALSNHLPVPYKSSKFTQILADSLNYSSINLIVSSISFTDTDKLLEELNFLSNFGKIEISPEKNTVNCPGGKSNLTEKISKLRNSVKNKYENVWSIKEENQSLKRALKKKSSIEEVEDLISENKFLRLELQQLIGRPLAENDLEQPDCFENALVLTEDLIKKRKLDLASVEMKEKLQVEGRCQVCTLKLPCKHSATDALVVIKKPTEFLELAIAKNNTPTFITGSDSEAPKRFRIRSCRGRGEVFYQKNEDDDQKMIKDAEKRLSVLSKIEAYREEKLRKEIEKMEKEAKIEKELLEQQKIQQEKKKKYFEMQKEKIHTFIEKKNCEVNKIEKKTTRPKSHTVRNRPISSVKIRDYEHKRDLVSEILRYQSKLIKKCKGTKEPKELADSIDYLYNK